MASTDIITVFSFPIKVLEKPRKCVWLPKGDETKICKNDVSHVVIEPSPIKNLKRVVEVSLGFYCTPHYADTFPEMATTEGIYN